MRTTRTLCIATAMTAALAALSACSASTEKAATGAAKSAVATVADAMSLTTKTTAGYTSSKVKMTMVIPTAGTMTMSGSMSRNPIAVDLTMNTAQLPDGMHLLMSGATEYINMGAAGAKQFSGKHWLKIDFASLGAQGKALADSLNKSGGQDPSTAVKLMTSSGDIKRVGQETVDGVSTTRYSGTVDIAKLAAAADPAFKSLIDQETKLGMSTETVDMWVNDQNLPVKVHETAATAKGTMDITIQYSDFGNTPVQITVPPAGDTTDLGSLMKSTG
ncbi:hypothetical protein ABIA33_000294 [Streptacidiphilus sp. MAP12-16]|uniref:hypothetical protein n=1 Tax=Streptacidiphilus sp. MAP12-16 TaxID=3156300 RepID=UPI003511FF02